MSHNGVDVSNAGEGIPLQRAQGLMLVMDTPKGRGVFACRDIPARTVIEVSPVLVLDPRENEDHIRKTDLYNYTYNWPYTPPPPNGNAKKSMNGGVNGTKAPTTTQAIIFGLGSMFNHSKRDQNVGWERDLQNLLITYSTLRDIKKGEELCISYGIRLTFEDTDPDPEEMTDEDWGQVLNIIDFIG